MGICTGVDLRIATDAAEWFDDVREGEGVRWGGGGAGCGERYDGGEEGNGAEGVGGVGRDVEGDGWGAEGIAGDGCGVVEG